MRITEMQLRNAIKKALNEQTQSSQNAGPKLLTDVQEMGVENAFQKYGADVMAIYLMLPVDLPILTVKRKMSAVQKELKISGHESPAAMYEDAGLRSALLDAIYAVGLAGRPSDMHRVSADRYY